MQIESIGWEFDVLQASAVDDNYPRIEAVFVGVTPAVAYDVHNQAKFSRTIEHHLRDLERALRQAHQAELAQLGSADVTANSAIIQHLLSDYHDQLVAQVLIPDQLELESLTLAGEWPFFWNEQAPLVQQKNREREPMPFSEPATPADDSSADDHNDDHPGTTDPYMPV